MLLATFFALCPFIGTPLAHAQSGKQRASSATTNYASLVDPFTGTGASPTAPSGWADGDTFPGSDSPFGMVQWSPDTVNAYAGGYDYGDNRIRGFSLTHLSGAGCNGYGDIPFMPYPGTVTSSPASNPSQYISTFSHSNESAYAGYYKVGLDSGVTTELTTTQRTGKARFTYPSGKPATLLMNVSGSINGVSNSQVNINGNTVSGWATSNGFCGSSANYTVYFYATFNKPFASSGTWQNGTVSPNAKVAKGKSQATAAVQKANAAQAKVFKEHDTSKQTRQQAATPANTSASGPGAGAYVTFDTSQNTAVEVSVGVSYVSTANAQANLNQENPSGDFNTVLAQSTQTWNTYLGEIQVNGGTAAQTATFYTAMYHVFLFPSVFSDDNGQYTGFDNKLYTEPSGHVQYANYSGWDIYRSEAQLLGLLAPSQASDIAQSMVNDYAQSGQLPKWSFANTETYVMVGDPADPIIADLYAFGGTGFDTQGALNAMVKEATQSNNIRPGLNYLENIGYLPSDGSYGCCNYYGAASTTLEYNSADFAIGAFAGAIGNGAVYNQFVNRAQNWENLLNTNDQYLEPRSQNTSFPSPYDPTSGDNWVEGDGAQYNWMVPFNLKGLFANEGGNAAVVSRLNNFFTKLDDGPNSSYAFLGNEPTLETPWEYDYAGAPYQTQNIVRQVENTLYSTGPNGLPGNDDLGEMSSWYVFATLGMFPETPGTADLALTSPLFPSITVNRPSGQTLQINAPGASASTYYVQSLNVNGVATQNPWLPPSFITSNETLDFTLSGTANTSWGADPSNAPPSYGSVNVTNGTFSTGFESGSPLPNWVNSVDSAPQPAGGSSNVTGICCGLKGPEAAIRSTAAVNDAEYAHNGNFALMYSGSAQGSATDYAYEQLFDLSGQTLTVGANTTLSYWVYPQSSTQNSLVTGTNSTCVAIDLIFSDGTNLRDSGATDQNGNRVHPAYQCQHLTLDSWNQVTTQLGSFVNGKTIVRIDLGYDQPNGKGGYRGYIDDIGIASGGTNSVFTQGVSSLSANQAQVEFQPNGWTAGYVILHYTLSGQSQQNVSMTYNSTTARWEYTVGNLSSGQSLPYSFTYQKSGLQYDTSSYSWTHP
jgi:predicted alpha-1,2-mannosidase